MARIKIDYSNLEDAAKRAGDAANEMEEYAKQLSQKVSGPVSSLTGGSTQYTTTVASLAQQKAKKLREKAGKYQQFQRDAQNLVTTAKAADKDVESYINRLKQQDSKNLTWGQKICATAYDLYSNFISGSDVGKVLNIMVSGVELYGEMKILAVKKARDFFVYGKGRYILNIALTVAAAVGAIVALCNPVTGPFAAIIMAAAVIAAIVKVATSGVTVADNFKALFMDSDDPGAARYYGNTSSLKDFAKKHIHDKKVQAIAGTADTVGAVADIVSSVGSLFTKTHTMTMANPDGSYSVKDVKQLDWSGSTLKENVLKKFGVTQVPKTGADGRPVMNVLTQKPVTENKFSGSKLLQNVFGIKSTSYGDVPSYYDGHAVYKTVGAISDTTDTIKNIGTPISEITKISELSTYGNYSTKSNIKQVLKHIPLVSSFSSSGFSIGDYVTKRGWQDL